MPAESVSAPRTARAAQGSEVARAHCAAAGAGSSGHSGVGTPDASANDTYRTPLRLDKGRFSLVIQHTRPPPYNALSFPQPRSLSVVPLVVFHTDPGHATAPISIRSI